MSGMISGRNIMPEEFSIGMDGETPISGRRFIAGGTITKNAIVYVQSTNSTHLDSRQKVSVASAAAIATTGPDLWIATHAATSGQPVLCVKEMVVGTVDTNSATAAGHPFYLTTSGNYAAAPTAAHSAIPVGYVLYKDATNGVLMLCPDRMASIVGDIPDRVIADPGNAGAIDVRFSSIVNLVSAGAETRTLAIPKFIGQRLLLHCDTYVGDIVITCAQAINAAGNTIMTFNAARDNIALVGVTVGGALRWEVSTNASVGLS